MKTSDKKFQSFLASSSRRFFKYGLGLSIFSSIVAFKLPFYSKTPEPPRISEGEIIEVEYITQIVPVEKIKKIDHPKKEVIEPIKAPPKIVTTTQVIEEPILPKQQEVIVSTNMTAVLPPEPKKIEPTKVYEIVEIMPEFEGGMNALYKYFGKNIEYNNQAITEGISGKVYIRFIVDKNGNITKAEVHKGVHPLLDNEALRVVKNMPNWSPGIQNGEKVNVAMIVPVSFVLLD